MPHAPLPHDPPSPGPLPSGPLLPAQILRDRAAARPTARAYVFLDDAGAPAAELTYGELHRRALAVARALDERCRPGDRALLLFPPGLDFVVAFFGCLYARVVAVPVSPPRRDQVLAATLGIAVDSAPAVVLTVGALVGTARGGLEPVCGALPWLAVDEITAPTDPGPDAGPRPGPADAVAFLQYTSGSTSAPKGVMVSHGNLAANLEMIRRAFGHDEHSTLVGWTPFFHDQGLIGNVLQPLYLGAASVLMAPATFLRRPLLWLSAISGYRAHTSGGPNFAFDVCVARAGAGNLPPLDLSCWKVAFNGAEPIRPSTLRRFAETFAPVGFDARALYPCYGLAEATLLVTGSRKGRGPRTVEADVDELAAGRFTETAPGRGRVLAGCGLVLPEETVRIVDPATRRPCPPHQVGEIWVSGPHVARGYWERPRASVETFQARCDSGTDRAGGDGGDGRGGGDGRDGGQGTASGDGRAYLRTGDLGVLFGGELYVLGRRKDMVIIRGRNHYPQDIERTAESAHPALRPGCGAAFSVPGPDGERLVVVQEISREWAPTRPVGTATSSTSTSSSTADAAGVADTNDAATLADIAAIADIAASIRAAVVREHEVSLRDVVLVRAGELAKTSSGKIMRSAARDRYLHGGFELWAPLPSPVA